MRLGVLGGTFDPIHIGHLVMAQAACDTLGLDLVLFVPAGHAPHRRPKNSTDSATRVAMVQAAIADDPRFALSTVDVDRMPPHYTADTLALIAQQYGMGADDIHFVIGSDSLTMLHTWYRPDLVVRRCRLAVAPRQGYPIDLQALDGRVPGASARVDAVEMPAICISSTLLRDMVNRGRSIRYLVPDSVARMIQQGGLYRMAAACPPSEAG